jgi:hypothetical protein
MLQASVCIGLSILSWAHVPGETHDLPAEGAWLCMGCIALCLRLRPHTQVHLATRAEQEQEALQREGDQLDVQVSEAQRGVEGLHRALADLSNSNAQLGACLRQATRAMSA